MGRSSPQERKESPCSGSYLLAYYNKPNIIIREFLKPTLILIELHNAAACTFCLLVIHLICLFSSNQNCSACANLQHVCNQEAEGVGTVPPILPLLHIWWFRYAFYSTIAMFKFNILAK